MIYILITLSLVLMLLLARELASKPTNEKFAINDALLSHTELMAHAKSVAKNHVISTRRRGYNFLFNRLDNNYKFIMSVYKRLNTDAAQSIPLCPASEWLLDNFYIIEEQYKDLKLNIAGDYYDGLKILEKGPLKNYPRIFSIGLELVSHTDGRVDKDQLVDFLEAYQSVKQLTMSEIWSLSSMIKISTMEKIRSICEKIESTQFERERLHKLMQLSPEEFLVELNREISEMKEVNASSIEHLMTTMKREEWNNEALLHKLSSRLVELDTSIEAVVNSEHQEQAGIQITIGNCITSLRHVNTLDWEKIFEKVSLVEKILSDDPSAIYKQQDFETRDYYRHIIEVLSKKHSISETKIARQAIALAQQAFEAEKQALKSAQTHVGFYLVGDGKHLLKAKLSEKSRSTFTNVTYQRSRRAALYIALMLLSTTALTCLFFLFSFQKLDTGNIPTILILLLIFWIPISEIVTSISNRVITKCIKPSFLPKLEYRNGLPKTSSSLVIVPTLTPSTNRVEELMDQLETLYLSNNEKNVHFALVGDLKDSEQQTCPEDEEIVTAAIKRIRELNRKYPADDGSRGKFLFFMRERTYNSSSKKWMGWERKRGAIVELNNLIKGSTQTSYAVICGDFEALSPVKYVITIDADSIMPIGTVRRLIGTIAHPINRAVLSEDGKSVNSGYGIIQPRIGISITSANKSMFSRIFAGQGGVDSYTRAVSDVYQDLFGEGIFTGKGIYDLDVFTSVLNEAIPDNTVLSHDLLEGSYLRVGLATDLEIIDGYPEKYVTCMMRQHRWVRGDWQLVRWLFPKIRDRKGVKILNPLSELSKWKIFDNLRRSLLSISLMSIFIASVLISPGTSGIHTWYWLGLSLLAIFLPFLFGLFEYLRAPDFSMGKRLDGNEKEHLNGNLVYGLKSVFYETILTFLFLPYNSFVMIDAVIRTLCRITFSKGNMLEWVTAADAERNSRNDFVSYMKRMSPSLVILYFLTAVGLLISRTGFFSVSSVHTSSAQNLFLSPISITLLLLVVVWSISPWVAYKISIPSDLKAELLSPQTNLMLRRIARKTWYFYQTFATEEDHYLPPDNYQIEPVKRVAHRTSPTNIGLMMASVVAARDFGYLTTSGMIHMLSLVIQNLEPLPKWNGHLYNWYDTKTLKILHPAYISTVDSGNFTACLITIRSAILQLESRPLVSFEQARGLRDTLALTKASPFPELVAMLDNHIQATDEKTDLLEWYRMLLQLQSSFKNTQRQLSSMELLAAKEVDADLDEINRYFPMFTLDPTEITVIKNSRFKEDYNQFLANISNGISPKQLKHEYVNLQKLLRAFITTNLKSRYILTFKRLELTVSNALSELQLYDEQNYKTIDRLSALIDSTSFDKLYNPSIGLFSIGFNIESNHLTDSYYDLLASEARIASYIAVARREVPSSHWFKLGRSLTHVNGYKSLVSWTGTMFEYFMPALLMKVYDNTLLDETYKTVLKAQIAYGRNRHVPWGTSESGFHTFDLELNYQYKAFGVPELGLKRGLANDMVVSPYSTVLGLPFAPKECASNLKSLIEKELEGEYGLFEAVDFTPERTPMNRDKAIVQSFMAHHQGMILLSLNNYLYNNIMVQRFHSCPCMKSAEFLLQERIPVRLLITKEHKELITPLEKTVFNTPTVVRRITDLKTALPECHFLSNGSYVLLLTSKGQSSSRKDDLCLTRWREGISASNGMSIFLKEICTSQNKQDTGTAAGYSNSSGSSNVSNSITELSPESVKCQQSFADIWNPTYDPLCDDNGLYEARFSPDKAEYFRNDTPVDTHLEICVSPEDHCELRKITLTNNSNLEKLIELTSYSEVVLASLMADIAHPVFNSLFIRTEAVGEYNGLLASKRSRENGTKSVFSFHSICCSTNGNGSNTNDSGSGSSNGGRSIENKIGIEYETDRSRFLGRSRTLQNAYALSHPLSNTVGCVLDPVFSLRCRIRVAPGSSKTISFLLGVSETKEGVLDLMKKYNEASNIERAFELAYIRSQMSSKYLNLKSQEHALFDSMLSHIIFISPTKRNFTEYRRQNTRGQSALWSHGLSGDLPIVLVTIRDSDDIEIVKTMVKAHEYWRTKGLRVDLVILNEDENSYIEPLQNLITEAVLSSNSKHVLNANGGIFIKSARVIQLEDSILFHAAARIIIRAELGNIRNQLVFQQLQSKAWSKASIPVTSLEADFSLPLDQPESLHEKLMFFNDYGGFDTNANEYVIRLKAAVKTPAPWINVVSNKRFGFLVSESGSGFTWSLNSRENKLTSWSNDPVSDPPSEALYLRDDENGNSWTITPLPIREPEEYTIHHGNGYSSFHHYSNGISQELVQFVPINDEKVKISLVRLTNNSLRKRELSIFYYVKPVLGSSEQLTQSHIHTSLLGDSDILTARNSYSTDFSHCMLYVDTSLPKTSITGDQTEFIGSCGCMSAPNALRLEKLSGSLGSGYYPCCAFQSKLSLMPGESLVFSILLGESDMAEEILEVSKKYKNIFECENALSEAKAFWRKTLGEIQIDTPDPSMNVMMNSWLLYQTIACRLWARSAFYQSGGAYGFRDQLQDVLSIINILPDVARSQILLHCEHQFTEGDVQHWWHPYSGDKGIRTRFSDDLLWLPYVVAEYVRITGSTEILDAQAGFLEAAPLDEHEDEHYGVPVKSTKTASVYEHCMLSISHALKFGDNGIPLMGSGDWNDGMNTVGNKGKGESVWMGWFLCSVLESFSEICSLKNDLDKGNEYQKIAGEISKNIEANAWDGKWYRRAYFDDGTPLGSSINSECSIDSLSQSWASISGFGDKERTNQAMESLENYLIRRDVGLILLFTPPFDNGELSPGYIKGYVPGVRENGGQYTHAAAWVIYAYAQLGDGDMAHECFKLINPITHTMTQLDCARYKVEPYVLAADVYNLELHSGRGGWTWYTGSSSWMYKIGLEKLLGFHKTGTELIIDPCIPKVWPEFQIQYQFPGCLFKIKVKNPAHVSSGVKEVIINGILQPGQTIQLADYYGECQVEILLG